MAIRNITRGRILAETYTVCRSITEKARGLMFSPKKSLIFIFDSERRISLHMFFVFFPIDVVFLDRKRKIVDLKENFLPFSFYTSKKKALYVIELPKGAISRTGSKPGDTIEINP